MDDKRNLHGCTEYTYVSNRMIMYYWKFIYMFIQNKKLWYDNNNLLFSDITLLS